jgi:AmmeMemoRadiSam system protein B
MKREMSVAGSFYPAESSEIKRYFDHFTKLYDEQFQLPNIHSRAVIVPHAGYIYSGYTANVAYRILRRSKLHTLVIIGPSHRVGFHGTSLCEFESYTTPFGDLPSAKELAFQLKQNFSLQCLQDAHHEHSTEVQFPYVKYYMKDVKILEIVYGEIDPKELSKIIDFILEKEQTGIIISTDLSHFHTLQEANKLDAICADALKTLNIQELYRGCEACGKTGVEAMMQSAKRKGLHVELLDYRTSADTTQDAQSVVGYLSACFSGF